MLSRLRFQLLCPSLTVLFCLASPMVARAATTTRVTLSSSGVQSDNGSFEPDLSTDGRFVTFNSVATNLVPNDTNGVADVFVRDQQTNTTERVSVNSDEAQGNNVSTTSFISGDGRFVVFQSFATNLVEGDTNQAFDVFVRDRQTGTTERVSVNSDEAQSGGNFSSSFASAISADGRYVVFESDSDTLAEGEANGQRDVLVRDRQAGTTTLVSRRSDGGQADGGSVAADISANGRYVTFTSDATNLATGDTNARGDVFVRDLQTNTTTRVSLSSSGTQGSNSSTDSHLSGDGRYVAFTSNSSTLVADDTNSRSDVFVRDRQTNTTTRVNLTPSGAQSAGDATARLDLDISDDGRFVVFQSNATDLVAGDTNDKSDAFVRDRQTNTTTRVSLSSSGAQADSGVNRFVTISGNGRFVAWPSFATNLVPNDTNGKEDIFVRDRGPIATPNVRPQNVKLEAIGLVGAGTVSDPINKARLFRATYRDTNGYRDVRYAYLQIKTGSSNVLRFAYDLPNNKLYLLGDDGKYKGGIPPGTGSILSNSLGTISFKATVARVVDANTFQIDWTIAAKAPLIGTQPVLLYVTDKGGLSDGFDRGATWTITSAP